MDVQNIASVYHVLMDIASVIIFIWQRVSVLKCLHVPVKLIPDFLFRIATMPTGRSLASINNEVLVFT